MHPDIALLTGEPARSIVRAVLDAERVELVDWSVHQVHHRPGVGVSVGWSVAWADGDRGGQEYLVGTTAAVPNGSPGSTTVTVDGRRVTVWRHPADPALPGLAAATDPPTVGGWLGEPVTALDLVTYRPLRRSVLRARTAARSVYLKVVRPATADLLVERHTLLRAAGAPAASARQVAPGVVLLEEVPGSPLTDALAHDGAAALDPRGMLDLLDRLPDAAMALPRRPGWAQVVQTHAEAATAVLPGRYREIDRLARRVRRLLATADPGPVVPTHGDLYEANLLVEGGAIVGLLDVDALGPGHRVDDLACALGHLSVLPVLAPHEHRHVPATLARWTAAFDQVVDPVALRAAAAAVALSLVAGARREGHPDWRLDAEGRLAAAEAWVASATALRGSDERSLIGVSAAPHAG